MAAGYAGMYWTAGGYATLSRSVRYQILLDVERARKPETRARRIARHVERLAAVEIIGLRRGGQ